jgi:hypothetical protein
MSPSAAERFGHATCSIGARATCAIEATMKSSWLAAVLIFVVAFAAVAPAQTRGTGRVMREKLGHSQKILEAILTSNFAQLDSESAAFSRATESSAWTVLKGPEYARQSELFLNSLRALRAAGKERDLDAAMEQYTSLTKSCFGCHRYMKDKRIALR